MQKNTKFNDQFLNNIGFNFFFEKNGLSPQVVLDNDKLKEIGTLYNLG